MEQGKLAFQWNFRQAGKVFDLKWNCPGEDTFYYFNAFTERFILWTY